MDHHPEGLEEVKNIPHEVSLTPCDILVITRRDGIRNENILCRSNGVPIQGQQKHLRLQLLGHAMRMNRNVSSDNSFVAS